jgi:hypothetical protein
MASNAETPASPTLKTVGATAGGGAVRTTAKSSDKPLQEYVIGLHKNADP